MLKLKFQYFDHLIQRANSLEQTLMLGKTAGRRRRGWQRTRWLEGIIDSMDISLRKLWQIVKDREAQHAAVHRVKKSQTQLSDCTTRLQQYVNQELPDVQAGFRKGRGSNCQHLLGHRKSKRITEKDLLHWLL